jgi:hypothetical protein
MPRSAVTRISGVGEAACTAPETRHVIARKKFAIFMLDPSSSLPITTLEHA